MKTLSRTLTEDEIRNNRIIRTLRQMLTDPIMDCYLWPYPETNSVPGLYVICAPVTICGHCILSDDNKILDVRIYDETKGLDTVQKFQAGVVEAIQNLIGKSLF